MLHGNLGMHKCILFDVDGTLIDSSPGLYSSFLNASNLSGLEKIDEDKFRNNIGPPIDIIFSNFYDRGHNVKEKFIKFFREDYDNRGYLAYKTKFNIEVLKKIKHKNIYLGIVTNKPSLPTLNILEDMRTISLFDDVVCKDTFNVKFNKRHNLKLFLSKIKNSIEIKNSEIIYIGDTPEDHDAASFNNISFAGVADGFHSWDLNSGTADIFPSLNSILNKYIT
jgi:phosphoglycolate phosphatase